MSIDRQKAPQLVSLLAVTYGLFLTGCASASEYPSMPPVAVPTVQTVLPALYPELLAPKTIREGAQMAIYPQGGIINLIKGIDLVVNEDRLFLPDSEEQNLTYLFPQSFVTGNGRQNAIDLVKKELPLVMKAFAETQRITHGRVRFSIFSVGDVMTNVANRNPGIAPGSENFRRLASVELSEAYLGVTRLRIYDIDQTPAAYPQLSPQVRSLLLQAPLPLAPLTIDLRYLVALGLYPTNWPKT